MRLNDYLMQGRELDANSEWKFRLTPRIFCKDGFSISVQATEYAYCQPRQNQGPWHKVECGFPSAKPETLMEWCEDPEKPMDTVYGYVPINLVEELLEAHGGMDLDAIKAFQEAK